MPRSWSISGLSSMLRLSLASLSSCMLRGLAGSPFHRGEVLEVLAVVLELLLFIAVLTSFLSFVVVVV